MALDKQTILTERLHRQHLIYPLDHTDQYEDLFCLLQPVSTMANARPGSPPCLIHRTRFDDSETTDIWREDRYIVKGRFLGGGIGYVLASDLELYANAFCKPLALPNMYQSEVFEAVQSAGPLTPRQLKDETGLLNKRIMPALHRLQQAFLVYEDQVTSEWERSWYDFESEWMDVVIDHAQQYSAIAEVLKRFLEALVFATFQQFRDWSRFTIKHIHSALQALTENGLIQPQVIEGLGQGWILTEDVTFEQQAVPPSVYMLHKADILVRSHMTELKKRFKGLEVLQYLLIDGELSGAVVGHWRIGPHDVDDIVLHLSLEAIQNRRDEVIAAVAQGYHPPYSTIRAYAGERII